MKHRQRQVLKIDKNKKMLALVKKQNRAHLRQKNCKVKQNTMQTELLKS